MHNQNNYELCIMNCIDASFFETEKSQSRKVARSQDSRFKVQSSKFKVQGSRFKAQKKISGFQILRFSDLKKSTLCCLLSVDFLLSLQFTYLHYI